MGFSMYSRYRYRNFYKLQNNKTIVCFTTKIWKNIGILFSVYQMDADNYFNKIIKSKRPFPG